MAGTRRGPTSGSYRSLAGSALPAPAAPMIEAEALKKRWSAALVLVGAPLASRLFRRRTME